MIKVSNFLFSLIFLYVSNATLGQNIPMGQNVPKNDNSWISVWHMAYGDINTTSIRGFVYSRNSGNDSLLPLKNVNIEFVNRKTKEIHKSLSNSKGFYFVESLCYDFCLPDSNNIYARFNIVISCYGYNSIIIKHYEPRGDSQTSLNVVLISGNKKRKYNAKKRLRYDYKE
jgi:hypothetical protein